jgi:hypothetical protein
MSLGTALWTASNLGKISEPMHYALGKVGHISDSLPGDEPPHHKQAWARPITLQEFLAT